MGMGEPLLNYENTKKAIEILTDIHGKAFRKRKITISTSGIVPQIYKLTDEIKGINLAISLHSAIQPKRNFLMPGLRNESLKDLKKALAYYIEKRGSTITLE